MDRPTKSTTTKNGHRMVVYTWITKGERLQMEKDSMADAEGVVNKEDGNVTLKKIVDPLVIKQGLLKAVKSIDDRTTHETIVNYVMNELPEWEADEIIAEVDRIIAETKEAKKKE